VLCEVLIDTGIQIVEELLRIQLLFPGVQIKQEIPVKAVKFIDIVVAVHQHRLQLALLFGLIEALGHFLQVLLVPDEIVAFIVMVFVLGVVE